MLKAVGVSLCALVLSSCVVGTAVGIATDVVVGTVDITTDVIGTVVDVAVPDKKKQ